VRRCHNQLAIAAERRANHFAVMAFQDADLRAVLRTLAAEQDGRARCKIMTSLLDLIFPIGNFARWGSICAVCSS